MKQSILTEKMNAIYEAKDVETARGLFLEIVQSSRINEYSKRTMINNAHNCSTLIEIQKYATNSMFKFEGMGSR